MTAAEHYRDAERLLDLAETEPESSPLTGTLLAAAQVHATLALAGHSIDPPGTGRGGDVAGGDVSGPVTAW